MRAIRAAAFVLLLSLIAFATTVSAEHPPPPPVYRVIVNPKNPLTTIERTFLQDAFLKKTTRWPSDSVIRPVDLLPASEVRAKFSQQVLGRSIGAVRAYWQQRIFSGTDIPPPEVDSDDKVIGFVLRNEGAVGYVSANASLNGAKLVNVIK
jgi:ABC-type phosphate transport system substrate-binding protein